MIEGLDCYIGKSRGVQLAADLLDVVIAVRNAGHESRWIVGKDRGEGLCHDIGEFVLRNAIPHVEEIAAARFQDPPRLPIALNLVGKKHRAELTDDRV